ncbi:TPA: spore maturation protein, partial [Legionella pneumophila]|nr:spore maturation protein [Legionella pneumophila]
MNEFANHLSNWMFLTFIVGIPLYGAIKKVNVFDAFIIGAKQGFDVS